MRARGLKPGFFKNELLGSADPLIQLLFAGLWCMADREGRLEDRPLRICAELFPYRRAVTEAKVHRWLDWLQEHGFIVRYVAAELRAIQICEFAKHQRPHSRELPSQIPGLNSNGAQPGRAPVAHPGNARVALTPSSLTPDSGPLTPHSLTADCPRRAPRRPDTPVDTVSAMTVLERCRNAYPVGLYSPTDWLLAERELQARLQEGEPADELVAGCARYAAQCVAAECGSKYVRSPRNFFSVPGRLWREAFPPPTGGTSPRKTFDDYRREREAREAQELPGDDAQPVPA